MHVQVIYALKQVPSECQTVLVLMAVVGSGKVRQPLLCSPPCGVPLTATGRRVVPSVCLPQPSTRRHSSWLVAGEGSGPKRSSSAAQP